MDKRDHSNYLTTMEKTKTIGSIFHRACPNTPSTSSANEMAVLSALQHGGLANSLDPDVMAPIHEGLTWGMGQPQMRQSAEVMHSCITAASQNIFVYLHRQRDIGDVTNPDLLTYLTFPGQHLLDDKSGPLYDANQSGGVLSAAITFIGQFIDHDLTANPLSLFAPKLGCPSTEAATVANGASPMIDLDSMYGGRFDSMGTKLPIPMLSAYEFKLMPVGDGFDVPRDSTTGKAIIGDPRNDENQIIVQVHAALMRFHNAFGQLLKDHELARKATLTHWQAYVIHGYLKTICIPQCVDEVLGRVCNAGDTVHHPQYSQAGPGLQMPHEFAIGFRIGHAQIRDKYQLRAGDPASQRINLFDVISTPDQDLRGGKPLTPDRVIDWSYFESNQHSSLIDRKLSRATFQLPGGAHPPDEQIRAVPNLAFRNLQRSDDLLVCWGEDLAAIFEAKYPNLGCGALPPEAIEPDTARHHLFGSKNHVGFKTPLWYYLLCEAEHYRDTDPTIATLGPLGSLLISEVIINAIYHAPISVLKEENWSPDSRVIDQAEATHPSFANIIAFGKTWPAPDPGSDGTQH